MRFFPILFGSLALAVAAFAISCLAVVLKNGAAATLPNWPYMVFGSIATLGLVIAFLASIPSTPATPPAPAPAPSGKKPKTGDVIYGALSAIFGLAVIGYILYQLIVGTVNLVNRGYEAAMEDTRQNRREIVHHGFPENSGSSLQEINRQYQEHRAAEFRGK